MRDGVVGFVMNKVMVVVKMLVDEMKMMDGGGGF